VLGTRKEDASPIFRLTQNFSSGLAAPFEYLVFHGIKSGEFIAIGRDLRQGADTPVWYHESQDEVFSSGQVYDLSPDGIVALDELGQILHASQSILDLAEEATLAPTFGPRSPPQRLFDALATNIGDDCGLARRVRIPTRRRA